MCTFIPALIDCGVDILNPIQPGVYMMEHRRKKQESDREIDNSLDILNEDLEKK